MLWTVCGAKQEATIRSRCWTFFFPRLFNGSPSSLFVHTWLQQGTKRFKGLTSFSSWKQILTRSDLIPVPGGLCQFPEMDACSKHERQATLCMVIYPIILTWFVGTYHLCKISKPSQRRVNISTEFPVHSGLRSERMTHLGDWQPTQLNHFDHLLQNSDPFFIFLFQHVTFGELGNLVTWADHCDLPNTLLFCRNGM